MVDNKVVSTNDLIELIRTANLQRFNRRADHDIPERLDPEGVHIVARVLAFMNDGFFHRCRVFAKVPGSDEPIEFWLDVRSEDYEKLSDPSTVLGPGRLSEIERGV